VSPAEHLLDITGALWVLVHAGVAGLFVPLFAFGVMWGLVHRIRDLRQFSRTNGRALMDASLLLPLLGIAGCVAGMSDLDPQLRQRLDSLAPVSAGVSILCVALIYWLRLRRFKKLRPY
jgi:hypothetical protein